MSNPQAHQNPFIDEVYLPRRDLVDNYVKQAAFYLAVFYGYDYENMLEVIRGVFLPNENGFKEAKFKVLKKDKYGDRKLEVMPAREYFQIVQDNNYHLSPSLVAYTNANQEQAVNAFGTERFIDFRRLYKGKRQSVPKGTEDYKAYDEIQNALKIFNNAQSGGMSSSGTPLFNPSGHTTLTSTCRSVTGTVNLVNERLITGNRLLLSYNKTMELFVSTLVCSDREKIAAVIKRYEMKYATVSQVMDMVIRCANYYWKDKTKLSAIQLFLSSLSDLDLTILLCSMDLRGLYVSNPEIMKAFFKDWIASPEAPADAKEEDFLKPENADYKNLCVTKLGKGATKEKIEYLNKYHVGLEVKWKDFIEAFLKAEIPPTSIFSVKEMVRESVVTSDTDSSIYSVDIIVGDYTNTQQDALNFNGVLTYFIRCIAVDQHGRLSRNMNVTKKFSRRLNMKNEYLFSAYLTTAMSKHYCALQLMVEGVLNAHPELEEKGVHIRGIKIALKVREFTKALMVKVLNTIYEKAKLNAADILKEIGDIERALIEDLSTGGFTWLKKDTIKDEEVYTNPASSIYFYHDLWEKVFKDKYGEAPTLPYPAYKVNLDLSNKTKLKNYLESIKDSEIGKNLADALEKRDYLTSVYIPADLINSIGGIPREIIPIIDSRLIIQQNLNSIYLLTEAMGLFVLNSKATRLISDEH